MRWSGENISKMNFYSAIKSISAGFAKQAGYSQGEFYPLSKYISSVCMKEIRLILSKYAKNIFTFFKKGDIIFFVQSKGTIMLCVQTATHDKAAALSSVVA